MTYLGRIFAFALAALVAMVAPAFAQDMAGTYKGIGDVVGTTLVLQQSGNKITGQFSGDDNGTLVGQTDGAGYVEGYLTDDTDSSYTFYAEWDPDGIDITLYDTLGNTERHSFLVTVGTRSDGEKRQPPKQDESPRTDLAQKTDQTAPAPAAKFYTFSDGKQGGPFDLEALRAAIANGQIDRDTPVWQPGQPEWRPAKDVPELAGILPPPPPAPVVYYLIEEGAQAGPFALDEIIARIEEGRVRAEDLAWKEGLEAWTSVDQFPEFADLLKPAPTPPPVPVAPSVVEPTPPPPPPPPHEISPPPLADVAQPVAPVTDGVQPVTPDDQAVNPLPDDMQSEVMPEEDQMSPPVGPDTGAEADAKMPLPYEAGSNK